MGYRVQVGDLVEITIVSAENGQTALNKVHYACDSIAGLGGDSDIIASQYSSAIAPLMKAVLNTSSGYHGVLVQKIRPLPIVRRSMSNTGVGGGTVGVFALPMQTSGLISFYTDLAGRSQRGRFYVPFPGSSDLAIVNGEPVCLPGYTTRIQAIGTFIGASFVGGTLPDTSDLVPVIYHRKTQTATPITTSIGRGLWATCRRRGSYGRPNIPPV